MLIFFKRLEVIRRPYKGMVGISTTPKPLITTIIKWLWKFKRSAIICFKQILSHINYLKKRSRNIK